jgi:5'-3' exonuclease
MGIKGLKQFLLAKYPQALARYHLSHLATKKVAVDVLTPLYKYKAAMGDTWLSGMLSFLLLFPRHNVHATVFADGPCVPIEKKEEQEKRVSARDKIRDRVKDLTAALAAFKATGAMSEVFKTLPVEASSQRNVLLGLSEDTIDVEMVENYIEKLKKQIVHISDQDMIDVSRMCRALNIPFYTAKLEAESMCSWLCKTGQVDAVVSEDSDVLAYGSPMWISELDFQGNCMRICYQDVLREMEITSEQFTDFCIMCGTDFNHRVEKLGPVKALALLKEHGSIEKICEEKKISGEEWNTPVVRGIFARPCEEAVRSRKDQTPVVCRVRFNDVPNEERLLRFLREKRLPQRYAMEYFDEERIVFED